MSFDLASLEVHIRDILTSPGTDLSTISAKGVRQKLTDVVPWLTAETARQKKREIDEVITGVYQAICAESAQDGEDAASGEEADETRKRDQESDEENAGQGDDDDEGLEAARPAKRANNEDEEDGKRKVKKPRGSTNGTKKVGRPRKSAATVDSEAESGEEGKKKRTRKKSVAGEGGRARGGFAKEYTLSEPLAKIVGAQKLSRPQVVKQLWIYIKENRLQNPENGKEIILDDNMKALFGGDKINMFAMNKSLGQHLLKE